MSNLEGSKADVLLPQFAAFTILNEDFTVTDGNLVIPNFKIELTIPGRYFVSAMLRGEVEISGGDNGLILALPILTPLGETPFIPGPTLQVVSTHTADDLTQNTSTMTTFITINGPTTLEINVSRTGDGAPPTFVVSKIVSDQFGESNLTAVQILN